MKRLLLSVCLMMSLNACALIVDEVDLAYKAKSVPAPIGGADTITVLVTVNDARQTFKDRIGTKKNGYGIEMAAIVPKQSIPTFVSNSIQEELKARGFRMGNGPVFVLADVNKFYNDFKMGFFAGQAAGEIMLNVSIRNANGSLLYSKAYNGNSLVEGVMLASGENAKAGVEAAFSDALSQMLGDEYFIQALIDAQRNSRATGVPTS